MPESKHTPGPWKCELWPANQSEPERWVIVGDGIAIAAGRGKPEFNEPDARLIAATPDLLNAIKTLLALHGEAVFACGQDDEYKASLALDIARDAIAKAEGK